MNRPLTGIPILGALTQAEKWFLVCLNGRGKDKGVGLNGCQA